ncbi:lipoprotein [Beggiatoa sp. PS]|nr:lipoprotein [Beggiatoa sp. PS]
MKFPKFSVAIACILLGTSGFTLAQDSDDGFTLFSDSLLYAQLRPRFEYANVDGGADTAKAFTVRTVIGAEFNQLVGVKGLDGHIEATNVSHFGILDDYAPQQPGYDVIADPRQTRMSQAHITYAMGDTAFIAGRKMHTFDNQRFIGHVGWRQMPQTYDLIAVNNQSIKGLSLTGAYVKRVNRILADAKLDTNSVLLHANYTVAPTLKVSAYSYMLASIHDTFGIRATGNSKFSGGKFSYEAEYAFQNKPTFEEESMGNVQPDQEASYYKLGGRFNYGTFVLGLDYEVLGKKEGSEGGAFNTPLATLHGMNGWADKFLSTPADGLVDIAVTAGYISKPFGRVVGIYRNFDSDRGSRNYGSEFDIIYASNISKYLGMIAKAAFFIEGDEATGKEPKFADTTKYWLMFDYKFNL